MFECVLRAACIIRYGRDTWAMLWSKNSVVPCPMLSNKTHLIPPHPQKKSSGQTYYAGIKTNPDSMEQIDGCIEDKRRETDPRKALWSTAWPDVWAFTWQLLKTILKTQSIQDCARRRASGTTLSLRHPPPHPGIAQTLRIYRYHCCAPTNHIEHIFKQHTRHLLNLYKSVLYRHCV